MTYQDNEATDFFAGTPRQTIIPIDDDPYAGQRLTPLSGMGGPRLRRMVARGNSNFRNMGGQGMARKSAGASILQ